MYVSAGAPSDPGQRSGTISRPARIADGRLVIPACGFDPHPLDRGRTTSRVEVGHSGAKATWNAIPAGDDD